MLFSLCKNCEARNFTALLEELICHSFSSSHCQLWNLEMTNIGTSTGFATETSVTLTLCLADTFWWVVRKAWPRLSRVLQLFASDHLWCGYNCQQRNCWQTENVWAMSDELLFQNAHRRPCWFDCTSLRLFL